MMVFTYANTKIKKMNVAIDCCWEREKRSSIF